MTTREAKNLGMEDVHPERAVPARDAGRSDPARWGTLYRADMVRFAYGRLRDRHLAEDVVQEALTVALVARHRYAGQSSERTWLVGILNHKINDVFRKRESPSSANAAGGHTDRLCDGEPVTDSDNEPEGIAERALFREMITDCAAALPLRLRRAFILCDLEERSTRDAARALNVSISNLWVMLHRARRRLCLCLKDRVLGRSC